MLSWDVSVVGERKGVGDDKELSFYFTLKVDVRVGEDGVGFCVFVQGFVSKVD